MVTRFCPTCLMHYSEVELLKGKRCPECKGETKPRLVLAGMVMGAEEGEKA